VDVPLRGTRKEEVDAKSGSYFSLSGGILLGAGIGLALLAVRPRNADDGYWTGEISGTGLGRS